MQSLPNEVVSVVFHELFDSVYLTRMRAVSRHMRTSVEWYMASRLAKGPEISLKIRMLHAAWSDGPSDPEKETTLHMVLQRATRVYKGGVWVDTVFEYACPSACLVHRPPEFFSTYLFETISNSPCRFVALPMFQICKSDINAARCFPFTVIDQIYTHAEAHIECIGFGNKQCPLFVDYLDGSGSLDSIQQRAYVKYSKRPISGLNVVLYDDDMSLETGYPMQLLIWGVGLKLSDLKKLIPKTAQNHLSHRPG